MRRALRGAALAGVLAFAGIVGLGATSANAQGIPGCYGKNGAGPVGTGFVTGYGVGIATYPVPVVVNPPYVGYRGYPGYGFAYGRGYAGYPYPRHHRHPHHRYRY
jgi:hypothetical protein